MALDDVLHRLHAAAATTVLIDGRSGSGKSTLARRLSESWPGSELVRLDDVYPGWDGLRWASDHIQSALLRPRSDGSAGQWRSWDWTTQRPGPWHSVAPDRRLVVEGVGALTPASRPLADLAIWVQADEVVRKQRALDRDGDTYLPHWDRWAAQEEEFITRCHPEQCADLFATPTGCEFSITAVEGTT